MRGTKFVTFAILSMAGVIGAIAVTWYVININESSAKPVSTLASKDFPIASDLDELARWSDHVIRGTVIKEVSTTREVPSGERGPVVYPAVISTVRVDEVMKGSLTASQQITVGQTGIEDDPAPPDGSHVVLFLRTVDHSVARSPIPYNYFASAGPQGVFLIDVESNKITPMGPEQAPTNDRYKGAAVAEFLDEVRQAAARNPEPRPKVRTPQ